MVRKNRYLSVYLNNRILIAAVEQNPAPEKEKSHITFSQWNFNGLMVHNFHKFNYFKLLP